jgi:hypothetical protein
MGRPSKDATPCALLNKNAQLYKECDVCREAAEQPGGRRQWTINEWRLSDWQGCSARGSPPARQRRSSAHQPMPTVHGAHAHRRPQRQKLRHFAIND